MDKTPRFTFFLACMLLLSQLGIAQIESTQKVVASDRQSNVDYGYSVDVFGKLAVVGCKDDGTATPGGHPHYDNGAAYVYDRWPNSLNWEPAAKLKASDPFKTDRFGYVVATDGETIAVGSPFIDTDTAGSNFQINAGAVYIFEKVNGQWTETQKLVASHRTFGDDFGYCIAFRKGLLVIGAPDHDMDATGQNAVTDAGAVFIFQKNIQNGRWEQSQKLTSPNRQVEANFGESLSTDGETILVGARNYDVLLPDSTLVDDAGQLVFFEKNNMDEWTVTSIYTPEFQTNKGHVGWTVSLAGNWAGTYLTQDSAYTIDGAYAGKASIGLFHKNQDNTWDFIQKLNLPNFDTWAGTFGPAFALSENKLTVASKWATVHTPDTSLEFAGTAHLYRLDSIMGQWYFDCPLDDFPKKAHDFYGNAIATDGTHIIIGSTHEDEDVDEQNTYANSGGAYFYGECVSIQTQTQYFDCKKFEYGDSTYTQNTTIYDTVGCANVKIIQVSIFGNETVEIINNDLKVRSSGTVQWLDCSNGFTPIQGATDTVFSPQQNGIYAAEVSYTLGTWSCVDTTECIPFMLSKSIQNTVNQSIIKISPNPFSDILKIETEIQEATFQLLNVQGISLKKGKVLNGKVELSTRELPEGIYILKLINAQKNLQWTKFLVKHF